MKIDPVVKEEMSSKQIVDDGRHMTYDGHTQIASLRWANVGPTISDTLAQHRHLTLGQRNLAHRRNVGPTCWFSVGPTKMDGYICVGPTLAQCLIYVGPMLVQRQTIEFLIRLSVV